jgi:tRNA pseudouridine38-40 synthase
MAEAAACLLGEHDFTSYRSIDCQSPTPMRNVIRLEIRRYGDCIIMEIEANAFLHHMVRNIAGVLMAIGTGEASPDWSRQVLEARDRTQGGVTAPADGLYLVHVSYPQKYGLPALVNSTLIFPAC